MTTPTPIRVTTAQARRLERNLSGAAPKPSKGKRKSELMIEYLHTVERWIGRRLTPKEVRSRKFTEGRDLYVRCGLMWKE